MEPGKSKFLLYLLFIIIIIGVFFSVDKAFHSSKPQVSPSREQATKETVVPKEVKAEVPDKEEEAPVEIVEESPKPSEQTVDPSLIDYFTDLQRRNEGKKTRSDIVVRYYHHAPDEDKLDELKKYGFYIHERPVDGQLENYESNSIYYGDSVSTEDLQLIAYVMVQQGLPLRSIQPSLYHDSWKVRSIEIGTDTLVTSEPLMTLSEIKNFSN